MNTNHYFKITAMALVLATMSLLAACGNKSENNPQPVIQPGYGYQNCVNCQNIGGAVFFTATSTDYTQTLLMNWSFAGQNTSVGQSYPYNIGGMTPGSYYGPVSTSGQMTFSQAMTNFYCVIPAGTYQLVTYQVGQWASGIVNNLALQAIGPAQLMISFTGQVSSPGWLADGQPSSSTNPVGRMFGNLNVVSVNGQACQQNIMVQ